MERTLRRTVELICFVEFACFVLCSNAFAYPSTYENSTGPDAKHNFYQLLTGGFGNLVIVVMGLGGLFSLIMTRQGHKGKNAPVLGIIMLLVAATVFIIRVMIKSGMLGHEYLSYE